MRRDIILGSRYRIKIRKRYNRPTRVMNASSDAFITKRKNKKKRKKKEKRKKRKSEKAALLLLIACRVTWAHIDEPHTCGRSSDSTRLLVVGGTLIGRMCERRRCLRTTPPTPPLRSLSSLSLSLSLWCSTRFPCRIHAFPHAHATLLGLNPRARHPHARSRPLPPLGGAPRAISFIVPAIRDARIRRRSHTCSRSRAGHFNDSDYRSRC